MARVTVTTAAIELLPAGQRLGILANNEGPGDLYLKRGAGASPTDYTVKVPPGALFEPYQVQGPWNAQITGYASLAATQVQIEAV